MDAPIEGLFAAVNARREYGCHLTMNSPTTAISTSNVTPRTISRRRSGSAMTTADIGVAKRRLHAEHERQGLKRTWGGKRSSADAPTQVRAWRRFSQRSSLRCGHRQRCWWRTDSTPTLRGSGLARGQPETSVKHAITSSRPLRPQWYLPVHVL